MKKLLALIMALAMTGSVASYAQETPVSEEEIMLISEEATEAIPEKRIVEGTVSAVSEGQIETEDLVFNIGENTLVADVNLVPTEVKVGDSIYVVASTIETLSLPAQTPAYYVIVKESPEAMAPIFMTVDEVKNGFIYSADGSYKVSYEQAQVEMYRTKNIVKAEELTKGSEIFVYSDIMTMSIPALVNPEKIVIMSIAQEEEISKALALNELGILLGTDKGLELERDVTRAEAVALIQRTTMADRMVYKSNFDDVADSHWAYNYISWATEKGIVQGVGDNKFEPNRTVTAKELAMMLLNAQGIEAEFEDAFEKATEEGYVTAEDEINEEDTLTRDAVSKMIYNYLNR